MTHRFLPTRDQIRQAAAMSGMPALSRSPEILEEVREKASKEGPGVPPLAAAHMTHSGEFSFFVEGDTDTLPVFTSEGAWYAWMNKHHPNWETDYEKCAPVSVAGSRYVEVVSELPVSYVRVYGGQYATTTTREGQYVSREKHDL